MAHSYSIVVCLVSILVSCYADSLRFIGLGDWGGQSDYPFTTGIQLQVASQLAVTAEQFDSKFTLAIGDNFYYDGIPTDVHDSRFRYTFEDVYTSSALQRRWYIVLGNHDHNGNVTAQIAYTQLSKRWYLPSEYYTVTETIPGSNITVQFVNIDTVVFPGFGHVQDKRYDNAQNTNAERRNAETQLQWIEEQLSSSTADWLFVVGHYPVYSVCSHGPTENLIKYLKPLMEQYNVAAYVCGHDHDLQHIRVDPINLDYYVVGAGHAVDLSTEHYTDVPQGSVKFVWPDSSSDHGGFATFEILDRQNMKVVYYDDEGNVLYTHSKTNPRS